MNQDDCILRTYRRDRRDTRMVVGTVEQVGEKMNMGFTDFEELRRIMRSPANRRQGGTKVRTPKERNDPMHQSKTVYG